MNWSISFISFSYFIHTPTFFIHLCLFLSYSSMQSTIIPLTNHWPISQSSVSAYNNLGICQNLKIVISLQSFQHKSTLGHIITRESHHISYREPMLPKHSDEIRSIEGRGWQIESILNFRPCSIFSSFRYIIHWTPSLLICHIDNINNISFGKWNFN